MKIENFTEGTDPSTGNSPSAGTTNSPEASLTADDLATLREKAAKAEEQWNILLRTTADFENFKKRAARERQEALKYANEGLLEKLIPVMDSFEMALLAAQQTQNAANDSLRAGVNMILQQLRSVLTDSGLSEINAQGTAFDPNLHEAVSQKETTEVPEGHVVQQLRKGYRLRDRLLRPATVVVAKAPVQH